MMGIFSIFATPLGYVMQWINRLIPSYFVTIFVFTLLVRLLVFPLSIKNQKSQMERAKLAPRLERLQKKYGKDKMKLQEKTQQLYEKEGVSMTGGCLPTIVQMLVLMSVIAVIYKPLTYVQRIDTADLNTCATAITAELDEKVDAAEINRYSDKSYYREMYLMKALPTHGDKMEAKLIEAGKTDAEAAEILGKMQETEKEFRIFGVSLLEQPTHTGLVPNGLWIVAILSGITSLLTSLLSMRYSKASMSAEQQQMGGMTNGCMMYGMPVFSLIISFTVPGGVAVYWIFSNLLAMVQTVVLNSMYNPAKARAQAEIEYAERRRKKAEDKERLKAARLAEQAAWQREENEKRQAAQGNGKKKPAAKPAEDAPVDEIPTQPEEETPADNEG